MALSGTGRWCLYQGQRPACPGAQRRTGDRLAGRKLLVQGKL